MSKKNKNRITVFFLSLQIIFSLFLPLQPLVSLAQAAENQVVNFSKNSSSIAVSNSQASEFSYFFRVNGTNFNSIGTVDNGAFLIDLKSQSGEDELSFDIKRLVLKTDLSSYFLEIVENKVNVVKEYQANSLELDTAEENFLLNVWQIDTATHKATTSSDVVLNQEYRFPLNENVKVTFTKLPEKSSPLSIQEIQLSAEQQEMLGAVSAVAYDITTTMEDGSFAFDLVLPKTARNEEVKVKYAESVNELVSAVIVEEKTEIQAEEVKISDLDHMTLFIVVKVLNLGITLPFDGPDDNMGDVWTYRSIAGADTDLIDNPTSDLPENLGDQVVKMDAPGLGRSFLGYTGFSWEKLKATNLKEISWYKYATDVSSDHYLNLYIYKGVSTGSVVIVPTCGDSDVWEQCTSNGANIRVRYRYLTWTGWKNATKNFTSLTDLMNSQFGDWSLYNDPETHSSLTLISGSSTTNSNLLNYIDGVRFLYKDNTDDFYNFEAEADLTAPTVSFSPVAPGLINQKNWTVSVNFSETVNDLLAGELFLTNAFAKTFSKIDASHYTVELEAVGDGIVTLQVPADVVFDQAGHGNLLSEVYSFNVDATKPTGMIVTPVTNSFVKDTISITGTVADSLSGINHVEVRLRNHPSNTFRTAWQLASVDSSGNFSTTFDTTTINDDVYEVVVVAYDNAGNGKWLWPRPVVTVDNTAPVQPTGMRIFDHAGVNLGCDGYTNNRNIMVDWNDNSDSDFAYFLYDIKDKDGLRMLTQSEFSGQIRDLDGFYQYKVRAVDQAGNISIASDWCGVTLDRVAPSTTFVHDFSDQIFNQDIFIEGVTTDNHQVKIVYVEYKKSADSAWLPLFELQGSGLASSYSWDSWWVASEDGSYDLRAYALDSAGNLEQTALMTNIIFDRIAPVVDLTSPLSSLLRTTVAVRGSVNDANPHHYWLVIQNSANQKVAGPGTVNDSSSFTDKFFFNWNTNAVSDGDYTIKLEARDSANNKDAGSVVWQKFTVDNTAPVSTINSPLNTGDNSVVITNAWDGTIAGTASDNLTGVDRVELNIDDGSGPVIVTALGDTNWTYSLPTPPEGTYTISSHAIDQAGNRENTYTITIVYDKTIPEVNLSVDPVDPDGKNGWYSTRPTVTLTATDDNDPIYGTDRIEYQWDSKDGTWTTYTVPIQPSTEGRHVLYYRAIDKAGNFSEIGIKNLAWDQTELTEGPLEVDVTPERSGGPDAKVTWEAATDNVGIDHYKVTFDLLDGDADFSKDVASHVRELTTDKLTQAGTWKVTVTAYDGAAHEKSASDEIIVDKEAPAAPVLSLDGTGPGSVDLSWTKVDEADEYIILYGVNDGQYVYAARVGDTLNYTVQGLTAGNYYFVVRAEDSSGNQSANSNQVSTLSLLAAPGGGNLVAEGFEEVPEVLGDNTEPSNSDVEEKPAGEVLGVTSCNPWLNSLWWVLLLVQLIGLFVLEHFWSKKRQWEKLAIYVLAGVASFGITHYLVNIDCLSGGFTTWLVRYYFVTVSVVLMLAKVISYLLIEREE